MSLRFPYWLLALVAGITLAVAGCSNVAPLGPSATMPQPHKLHSPFVLQAMRARPAGLADYCTGGYAALADSQGWCYRKLGTPVTITSAAVSPVTTQGPNPPQYALTLTLPASEVPELTAVTTTAAHAHGSLALSIGRQTWVLPPVGAPFTGPQFEFALPTRSQALQLQRLLA